MIRYLLVDSNDVKRDKLKYWLDYWTKIEKENDAVLDKIYRID
jgi:hypothetical protein